MKIAFVQNKLRKTDGVSLEVDKWRHVLERTGHEVFYCAGNNLPGIHCLPELSLLHPDINRILRNGTIEFKDYASETEFEKEIEMFADVIERKLTDFISHHDIDLLIPNNLLSIGYNVPAVLALARLIEKTRLPTIVHSHDFYFEDSGEVTPTCGMVARLYEKHAPPDLDNVQHAVINKIAQSALKQRKNIDSTIVPNVFDFEQGAWTKDSFNADFRGDIGVGAQDLLFLQATRIMDRKGVEMAIDVVAALRDAANRGQLDGVELASGGKFGRGSRVVLVCAGYIETFGITANYHSNLVEKAARLKVDLRFVGDRVEHSRRMDNGKKIYSLWDSYVTADFVTYPSMWEGWGNQLIEAVFARKPVLLFEYPVYQSDLAEVGFEFVSLGSRIAGHDAANLAVLDPITIAAAADQIVQLLHHPRTIRERAEKNYELARVRFSYANLEAIVNRLILQTTSPQSPASSLATSP